MMSRRWRTKFARIARPSLALLTATLTVFSAVVLAAPSTASAAPFNPVNPMVYIAQGDPTQLSAAVQSSSGFAFQQIGAPYAAGQYNGIGYRTSDNYIYGIRRSDNHLVRIESNGAVVDRGALPITGFNAVGAFIGDRLYVTNLDLNTMFVIDVDAVQVVQRVPLTGGVAVSDWTFADGFLWGIAGGTQLLWRTNPTTGASVSFPLPAGASVGASGAYGAAWTYGNGNLGFSNNATGQILQLRVDNAATGATTVVSKVPGPANALNDGAAAPGQPVDLAITKTGPALFDGSGQITYTLTVSNTSVRTSSGWTVTDSLPAGLSNPRVAGGTSTYDAQTRNLTISGGTLAGGSSATVTVTANAAVAEGACITNTASVQGNEEDPNSANNQDSHQACAGLTALSIEKTSDAGQNSVTGDQVTYTVAVTNTGDTAYTAQKPASFTDNLSDVLDDATWNGDITATTSNGAAIAAPTLAGTTLSWSGALAVGATATFTYSVTLTNDGNGEVLNNACVPRAEVTAGQDPCASTVTEQPKLTIAKTADTTQLPENGGTVTYTVTVTNAGPGDTTEANPAQMSDDLSGVIDDGAVDADTLTSSVGTATLSGSTIDWTGVLAAGESATITYQVTYDANSGDQQLVNVACLPIELAQNPGDPCRTVTIPGAGLSQFKSVDPESGTAVVPGQQVTYTLTFSNTGQAPAAVDTNDDLSDVLDDATIVSAPAASSGNLVLGAVGDDGRFTITGTIPVGETYTVVYSVQVLTWAEQGNHLIGNVLADPTSACLVGQCSTENPIPHLSVEKDVSDTTTALTDVVSYTIVLTNDGEVDYTDASPASWLDDLSNVLDDATYNGDAAASSGTVAIDGTNLSWNGALPIGSSVEVTYSVTVTGAGNRLLENNVCTPANGTDDPECATTTTDMPFVVALKSSDPEAGAGVEAGQVITYTLTWTNEGTAPSVVDSIDDLARVLDDADVTAAPTASSDAVTVSLDGGIISTTGPIAAGETITVVYQVTVRADGDRGDNELLNQLIPNDPSVTPPPPVDHPVGELEDSKSVDPASGSTVQPGQVVTYTLTFENTGRANVTVARDDVLSNVLDDADITSAPASSDDALAVSDVADGRFSIEGVLAAGERATVSYQVTVRADGERGDDQLGNFLVNRGEEPPATCEPVEGQSADCTVNPVSNVTLSKSSDPESGTQVKPGGNVTYTLTFTNVSKNPGSAPVAVDVTDYLVDVLDDATLTGAPASSSNALAATTEGDTIRVIGAVPAGETLTVRYTITVKPYAEQGDHKIGNVVAVTGVAPVCDPGSTLCTNHDVPPPVPGLSSTGTQLVGGAIITSLVLALLGGLLLIASKRRRKNDSIA